MNNSKFRFILHPSSFILVVVSSTGCVGFGALNAYDLPADLQAPPAQRVRSLDLARLARPVDPEPRIYPGDLLEVSISDLFEESKSETFPVRVQEDGTIWLPMLSTLPIDSMTASQSEQVIRVSYQAAGLLRSPQISVQVVEQNTILVYVIGAVEEPGGFELPPDRSDLLSAIVEAGGLKEDASTIIQIRRRNNHPSSKPSWSVREGLAGNHDHFENSYPETFRVELVGGVEPPLLLPGKLGRPNQFYDDVFPSRPRGMYPDRGLAKRFESFESRNSGEAIIRLDLSNEFDIQRAARGLDLVNGDIVSIEPKKYEPFYIGGAVKEPGEFEMPVDRDIRVLEAIAMAGGVNKSSQPKHVLLVRQRKDGSEPAIIHIHLDRAKKYPEENIRLTAGDLVTIEEDALSALRGYFRDVFRIGGSLPLSTIW